MKAPTSFSQRYDDQWYIYWWDITDFRRRAIVATGQLILVQKVSQKAARIKASEILPLLTERRRTSRCSSAGRKGNWGLRVRPEAPNHVEVEGRKGDCPRIRVQWKALSDIAP